MSTTATLEGVISPEFLRQNLAQFAGATVDNTPTLGRHLIVWPASGSSLPSRPYDLGEILAVESKGRAPMTVRCDGEVEVTSDGPHDVFCVQTVITQQVPGATRIGVIKHSR